MRSTWRTIGCLTIVIFQSLHAQEAAVNSIPFAEVTRSSFAHWDRDQNGILSIGEIDAAVADSQTRGPEAAAVAALKRATRSSRYQLPQLTLPQIEKLIQDGPSKDRPDLAGMYRNGCERIEQANRELFVSGKPRLDTIHQGRLGNCYCLAPLGAVLHVSPSRISDMFAPQADGKFEVRLGDRVVRVHTPTDGEIAQTASNERDGVWVNLYEKAVGEACNAIKPSDQRSSSPIDALARGGSAGTMLSFITGHKIQRFSFAFAKRESLTTEERAQILAQLRTYLCEAVEQQRAMTCGTEKTTTPAINGNHAFAVLGYDRTTDRVKLWNPYGGQFTPKGPAGIEYGYATKDGLFEIPLADFVLQFAGMARETDLPAGDEPELPKLPTPRS